MIDRLTDCSKTEAEQCIMMAAKIISPVIDSSYTSGYNWCIEQVKSSQYMDLAHSLDIDKAIGFLRQKDFNQVSQSLHLAAYLTLEQPTLRHRCMGIFGVRPTCIS